MNRQPEKGKVGVLLSQIDGTSLTEDCIKSLINVDYKNMEIYVGDNVSKDYFHLRLLAKFPDINLVTYLYRKSYCETFNYLAKIAIEDGCEFIFIVNNDTRNFSKNYFDVLISEFDDKTVGMVGSSCFTYDGQVRQDLNSMKNKFGHSIIVPTEGFILRSEAWEDIGGFNEELNIYTEDLALQRDLISSGWKIISNNDVSFEHFAEATMSKMIFDSNYFRMRNVMYLFRYMDLPLQYRLQQVIMWLNYNLRKAFNALKQGKVFLSLKILVYSFIGVFVGLFKKIKKSKLFNL